MKDLEREFEQMVRANRSTIYTVCYMFSNDQDEVADLFQEVLAEQGHQGNRKVYQYVDEVNEYQESHTKETSCAIPVFMN